MKKLFALTLALCFPLLYCAAQSGFYMKVYAGSNASWGKNQLLVIDSKGNCSYKLTEVGKGAIDSSSFTLTAKEMKDLQDVLKQVDFFKLDEVYQKNAVDGMGILVQVKRSGNDRTVRVINKHIPQMETIVARLNTILDSRRITLKY